MENSNAEVVPNSQSKQDFTVKTQKLFSKLYGRKISREEAQEIEHNYLRLLDVLRPQKR